MERSTLEYVTGTTARTICPHEPGKSHEGWFWAGTRFVNPHDAALGAELVHVSDSCRALRALLLLKCSRDHPCRRLLLNRHPELWFDESITERETYLEAVIMPNCVWQLEDYLLGMVREARQAHPGACAHDERVRSDGRR